MKNNPLVATALLWLGTLVNVAGWIALSVILHFTDPVTITTGVAVVIGALGSGVSFVVLYFLYKRLVS